MCEALEEANRKGNTRRLFQIVDQSLENVPTKIEVYPIQEWNTFD